MRSLLIAIGLYLLVVGVAYINAFAEESENDTAYIVATVEEGENGTGNIVTSYVEETGPKADGKALDIGKIVSTYQEETGATVYKYEYDLTPKVIKSIYVLSDTVVEPVIMVLEDGIPQLFMVATRAEKEHWFFLDNATLLAQMKDGKIVRINYGCENLDEDIPYAYEFRDVLDNAKVVETVMVQLTPSPFGDTELDTIRRADTLQLVLFGKKSPLVLKSGTGEWQVYFDAAAWRKMAAKYDELRKKAGK